MRLHMHAMYHLALTSTFIVAFLLTDDSQAKFPKSQAEENLETGCLTQR